LNPEPTTAVRTLLVRCPEEKQSGRCIDSFTNESALKKRSPRPIRHNEKVQRHMKKVLAIKTPVGGIVQIIPRDDSETAVGLSWREQVLSEAEKEASRLYLFDEGFIEHAIGSLEPDIEIQRFLKGIIDLN
jgi:hypothetical protein